MALFESYERRIDKITSVLNSYGIASIEEAEKITKDAGLDVYAMVKGIQPICFENACWAYTVGAAIAIKKGCKRAADAAGVHLGDVDAGILQKAAVNADLAEFVFDQHNLFTLERFLDELFDQGRFACTQKAGENINFRYLFCHGNIPFYLKVCLCC